MSHPVYLLLQKLDRARLHYALSRHREDSILVSVTAIGERIDIDVFEDDHMEISRFTGGEDIIGDDTFVSRFIEEYKNE